MAALDEGLELTEEQKETLETLKKIRDQAGGARGMLCASAACASSTQLRRATGRGAAPRRAARQTADVH